MAEIYDELVMMQNALARTGYPEEAMAWMKEQFLPFRDLMTCYRCALMEIETKFRVLNEEFSVDATANPVETIKARIKSPDSIFEKMLRRGYPLTLESIEENMNDIAGVRIICPTVSDIYTLSDALLRQNDITLVQRKDYIANPKPNGYRSLHLNITTPVNLHDRTRDMRVEVQLRTLAMDVWASLEHRVCYKKDASDLPGNAAEELLACAHLSAEIDQRMQALRDAMNR